MMRDKIDLNDFTYGCNITKSNEKYVYNEKMKESILSECTEEWNIVWMNC